jgi:hypothetical protein
MGDSSLSQSGLFESREFEITDNGISVSIRGLFFRNRYTVPFEHLIREPVEFTLSSSNWRWLGVGCLVLSALFLFVTVVEEKGMDGALVSFAFFLGALSCMLGYRLTMRTFLRISESAMNVDIAQTQPSKEQVDAFVEKEYKKCNRLHSIFCFQGYSGE